MTMLLDNKTQSIQNQSWNIKMSDFNRFHDLAQKQSQQLKDSRNLEISTSSNKLVVCITLIFIGVLTFYLLKMLLLHHFSTSQHFFQNQQKVASVIIFSQQNQNSDLKIRKLGEQSVFHEKDQIEIVPLSDINKSLEQFDLQQIYDHPTVGIPTAGQKFNNNPVPQDQLKQFDQEILNLLQPFQTTNCEYARYDEDKLEDSNQDGTYIACKNYLFGSQGLINIGVNGLDSFGCQVSKEYNFPNYQYSCFNETPPSCNNNSSLNHFEKGCIEKKKSENKGFQIYTFQNILQRHNLINKGITLKINCEGCEWQFFKKFPLKYLDNVKQIIIQMHFGQISPQVWGNLDIIRTILGKFDNVYFNSPISNCHDSDQLKIRKLPGRTIKATLMNRNLIWMFNLDQSWQPWNTNQLNVKGCPTPDKLVYP